MKELYSDFVQKLKKLFGKFDEDQKRFNKSSNSEIARELGYSDAQFSRLINQSATEGEYHRAIQNVDRILRVNELESELGKGNHPIRSWKSRLLWPGVIAALLVTALASWYLSRNLSQEQSAQFHASDRDYTLRWAFETSFINPYTKLDELPDDCQFPCYKYQGKWELKKGYKIPFFRERNGFHYWAKEVNMYARCMPGEVSGNIFEGYEYQKHEIWYDKRELPIDSFLFKGNQLKEFYQDLDFSQHDQFVKVATVHTFFRNEFELRGDLIFRSGQVIGRDLEFVSTALLNEQFQDKDIISDLETQLNRIASSRLEDFSRPISCLPADTPNTDFHQISDGDEMSFSCQLTTSRVAMNYTKTFLLTNQYIKNSCRVSE